MQTPRQAAAAMDRRWCRDRARARMGRAGARTSGTSRDDPGLIYPNVEIGEGTVVHEGAIVGEPPRGATAGELETKIGAGSMSRSGNVIYAGTRIGANLHSGH